MPASVRRRRGGGRRPTAAGRLLAHDPASRRLLALAVVAGCLAAVAVVVGAWLMSIVIAGVFIDGQTLDASAPLLVALAALAVGRATCLFAADLLAQRAASRLKGHLRRDLTGRFLELGPAWTSRERSGELTSVIVNGLETLDAWLTQFQPARWLAVIVPLFVILVVLVLDPPTTLVLLFTGPVLVLLLALIGSRAGALTARRFGELRWMSAFFLDMLQGIATLKMFGRSREQVDNMRTISRQYGETTMEVLRTAFQTSLVLEWGGAVAMALVAVEVSLRLMADAISFDRALAVLIVTPEFFLPLRQLALRYHAGTAGAAVAERVFAILDEPIPRPPTTATEASNVVPSRALTLPPGPADISFEGVTFRYPGRAGPALDDLTLTIPAGRSLALVGSTGAGKSTAVNLLLRFLVPDAGLIRVGDTPLASIDLATWRSAVAWVPQSAHLFHGSVADNLRLARPDASIDELVVAAREAHAADFIEALPDGYEAQIGEDGVRLSGGQRQRLAIARAMLKDARFVILDEPTAHLDADSEAAVADAIERLSRGRTVLVISHRLRLARTSDMVAVLDAGRLVETGSPDDLLRSGGAYARLATVHLAEAGVPA